MIRFNDRRARSVPVPKMWTSFSIAIYLVFFVCGSVFPTQNTRSLKSEFLSQWADVDHYVTYRDSSHAREGADSTLAHWPDDATWLAYADLSQAAVFGDSATSKSDLDFRFSAYIAWEDSAEFGHIVFRVLDDDWVDGTRILKNNVELNDPALMIDGCLIALSSSGYIGSDSYYEISGRYPHDYKDKRYGARSTVTRVNDETIYEYKLGPLNTTRRDNRLFYALRDVDEDSTLSHVYGEIRFVPDVSDDLLRRIDGRVVTSDGSALSTDIDVGYFYDALFKTKSDKGGQFRTLFTDGHRKCPGEGLR